MCVVGTTVNGAILVAGTTSDAGKSVVTAGICRWLAREGVSAVFAVSVIAGVAESG